MCSASRRSSSTGAQGRPHDAEARQGRQGERDREAEEQEPADEAQRLVAPVGQRLRDDRDTAPARRRGQRAERVAVGAGDLDDLLARERGAERGGVDERPGGRRRAGQPDAAVRVDDLRGAVGVRVELGARGGAARPRGQPGDGVRARPQALRHTLVEVAAQLRVDEHAGQPEDHRHHGREGQRDAPAQWQPTAEATHERKR